MEYCEDLQHMYIAVYGCILIWKHLYFIVKRRRLAVLRYAFLGLPFTFSVLLVDVDIIRQVLSYFPPHLSC